MCSKKSVFDTLADEIGEEAAKQAIEALTRIAKQVREDRLNCRAMIVFDHPEAEYSANWGLLVTKYTREIDN